MRCKEHLSDLSSTIGVCATCLRLKLTSFSSSSDHHHHPDYDHDHDQKQPQPLILPRSVSPYITRRKSDQQTSEPVIQRFHSTPQVEKKKSGKFAGKFNLLSKIFRSKSSVVATTTSTANSEIEKDELTQWRNRGMSPETAAKTRPSPGRVKPSHGRLVSIAFCLSPLVRASPSTASRYHCGGGGGGGETSFSGEIRAGKGSSNGGGKSCNYSKNGGVNGKNPQLSEAASYCGNRSRKIADFGRLNRNR